LRQLFLLITFGLCCFEAFCQSKSTDSKSKPFILGEIDEIESSILHEKRTLNVYLPEGYKAADTTKYPVVYLLDGGADEDFIHIVGLYQFNSFPWINRVPPSIVVGITNSDRLRDMTFPTADSVAAKKFPTAGHSDKFIQFIEREVQPYIERKFRPNSNKTLIGESLGGLVATEILLKKSTLFSQYIIVSPSLWWNNGSLLNQPVAPLEENLLKGIKVYIGVGKEGLTSGNPPRVMEVDANLLADKLKNSKSKNLTVYFDYLPAENHATIMHQAVFNALRLLNP